MSESADYSAEDQQQFLLADSDPLVRPVCKQLLAGEISAQIALMYLLLQTRHAETVKILSLALISRLSRLANPQPLHADKINQLALLIHENYAGCERIAAMLRSNVDTDEPAATIEAGIAFCKRLFDWSVQQNPETSVALYSLGNPAILAAATEEIVAAMQHWQLLQSHYSLLEIGCGIGRFQLALSSRVAEITGIDVSAKMIETAIQRCAGLTNVRLQECSGYDLAQFPAQCFDVVFAVDSFPYLCQSGMELAETHFREAARVLKPGGHFLILNFSYRCDIAADRADVERFSAVAGFAMHIQGEQCFTLWDGVAFYLQLRHC